MTLTHYQNNPESWDELISLIVQEPDSLLEGFRQALRAAISAREEGYITDYELDALLREMVATMMSSKLDSIILDSFSGGSHPYQWSSLRRTNIPRLASGHPLTLMA